MCCVRLLSLGYLLLLKALDRDFAFSLNVSMESFFCTLIVSMLCCVAVGGEGVCCGWLWSRHILPAIWGAQSEDSHPCKSGGPMWTVDERMGNTSRTTSRR